MQILQWLFNVSAQEPPETESNSSRKRGDKDQNTKSSKDIVLFSSDHRGVGRRHRRQRVEESKLKCDVNLSVFCFLQRKDVSRPLFYHTLNHKRVGSFRHCVRSQSMKMKKEDSAAMAGNKVLPITDSSSGNNNQPFPHDAHKKDNAKMKAISRMKELMRWAASAKGRKSGKRGIGRMVLNFKNKAALQDDDQLSNESPKISFKWDTESCSTTWSAISSSLKNEQLQTADALNSTAIFHVRNHCASDGAGNWITTDSEFVVLEL